MRTRILLVEDDHLQAEFITTRINKKFGTGSVVLLRSESQFVDHVRNINHGSYDVVVLDVMLRWDVASRDMRIPTDYAGPFSAGIRCRQLLLNQPATRRIPVILYTVLDRKDLPKGVDFMAKDDSAERLIAQISVLTQLSS